MPEYIERETTIKICDKYYQHCLIMHDFCGDSVAYDIRADIEKLPTADVVEVVRCKDCEFYKLRNVSSRYKPTKPCCLRKAAVKVDENDFCSYGKRKEGAEE